MKPYTTNQLSEDKMVETSKEIYSFANSRRSVREYSDRTVPIEVIENAILTAGTAPSGANKQPWTYCVVTSPELKKKIRVEAEKEEFVNYHGRMSEQWLQDLEKFGTDHIKEFLEIAPALVIVFKRIYEEDKAGSRLNNYYVNESVGISVGMFLSALHRVGLAALTHTPSPMNFLASILQRPENERAFLLIPVGYPAKGTTVPDIDRKGLSEIMKHYK